MSTFERLTSILQRDYGIDCEAIGADATLTTLGLDSLGVLELMFKIEDTFGLKIDDDPPTDLRTIGNVVEYIDGLLARAPRGDARGPVGVAGAP